MRWVLPLCTIGMGCSSWELTHTEKEIASCWFSDKAPVPVEGGINWGLSVSEMNVGYDLPYDGIDQNCDGKDDFDLDGDGFVPALFATDATQVDCWDSLSTPSEDISGSMIFPQVEDAFYDGIDQNCDGGAEFDRDGDGYGAQEYEGRGTYRWDPDFSSQALQVLRDSLAGLSDAEKQEAIDAYFSAYTEDDSWVGGDCWDNPAEDRSSLNDLPSLSAAEVFPEAVETFYDGIDQNCDGASDFDQDLDGFESNLFAQADGSFGADCNDLDETLYPNPEAIEIYYNGKDDNCDQHDGDGDQDGDGFWDSGYFSVVDESTLDVSVVLPTEDIFSDCDDTDALIYPDATERCNGLDDNCDVLLPEEEQDIDQDGFVSCNIEDTGWEGTFTEGFLSMDSADCNDGDSFVYPGAAEIYGDGVDQSCDGTEICYIDADLDGFRGEETIQTTNIDCSGVGEMLLSLDVDCDDESENTYPGAAYNESETACMRDADEDGYGSTTVSSGVSVGTDCDDALASVNPSVLEICDEGIDNDCDTLVDDADDSLDVTTGTVHYADIDIDGFGDPNASAQSCIVPSDRVEDNTDCDDTDDTINPNTIWYLDIDLDGFGGSNTQTVCVRPSTSHVQQGGDCNDQAGDIFPGAIEIPADGVDQNCDQIELCYTDSDGDSFGALPTTDSQPLDLYCIGTGMANDLDDCDDTSNKAYPGVAFNDSSSLCMFDSDGDGFGSTTVSSGVDAGTDCDDTLAFINPNAVESCDEIDNDCDTLIDDADPSLDLSSAIEHFADFDGDGFGSPNLPLQTCIVPIGRVEDNTDCDDSDAVINPNTVWYEDADFDGFGNPSVFVTQCVAPLGHILQGDDCNDSLASITDGWLWYFDADSDGIGVATDFQKSCTQPSGYTNLNGDCNDNNAGIHSICLEEWDGVSIAGISDAVHGNDLDRFASSFSMGDINGTTYYGFGASTRKYNNKDGGGLFLFSDLLQSSFTTDSDLEFNGFDDTVKQLGTEVLLGEDVTNDGVGDLVFSLYDTPRSICVYDGLTIETAISEGAPLTERDADYTIQIGSLGDRIGKRIFWEDITGDGNKDLIFDLHRAQSVGIIHTAIQDTVLQNSTLSNDYFFLGGEASAVQFGFDFDMLDANNDGQIDIAVADPKFNSDQGRVYVRLGPIDPSGLSSPSVSASTSEIIIDPKLSGKLRLGNIVRVADVDNDGVQELIVSENSSAGSFLYVFDFEDLATQSGVSLMTYFSTSHTLVSEDDASLIFRAAQNEFNITSIDMIDGFMVIGASIYGVDLGAVAFFDYPALRAASSAANKIVQFDEAEAHLFIRNMSSTTRLGSIVSNIGDINGDGFDDLVIGSNIENGGEGVVRVIPGPF